MSDNDPAELLKFWIARRAAPAAMAWLEQHCEEVAIDSSGHALGRAISMTSKRMGNSDLGLSMDDRAAAARARANWTPIDWSVDRAARILLLLSAAQKPEGFAERLKALAAHLGRRRAGCDLFWFAALSRSDAADGPRRGGVANRMRTVLEAVAQYNPFPAEQFP